MSTQPFSEVRASRDAEHDAEQVMDRFVAQARRAQEIAATLDPSLPMITRVVVSGDLAAAESIDAMLRAGQIDWHKATLLCGSYARLNRAIEWQEAGYATREQLLDALPYLWIASDPDDTDPRYLALWREARERVGAYVSDNGPLPRGAVLAIYRGQPKDAPEGIAWSLSRATAQRFADGASVRTKVTGGIVLTRHVERDRVLAYLTGRGESEVIIDPSDAKH